MWAGLKLGLGVSLWYVCMEGTKDLPGFFFIQQYCLYIVVHQVLLYLWLHLVAGVAVSYDAGYS